MSYLVWLVPIALGMGCAGLMAFLWSMRSGQYEDLDGAAERILLLDPADGPLPGQTWLEKTVVSDPTMGGSVKGLRNTKNNMMSGQ